MLLVVGPSGSGKSTLARAIAGLVPRDVPGEWAGSLRVGDLDVASAAPAEVAAQVGILFQDPGSQLVMDRAADDVAFGLENRTWPLEAMRTRVPAALAAVGLGGFGRRRGTRLSGGEQQRLALAGVEAPAPAVLVLDEPTANLDPAGAIALFERLAELRVGRRTTIVLVEHRADLAWPLADRVLALDESGAPIAFETPARMLSRHGKRLALAGIWVPADLQSSTGLTSGPERPAGIATGLEAGAGGRALVEVRHARYAYARGAEPAVRDIDLEIRAGERVALVGPNGSGKSTLVRLVGGLFRPGAGSVLVGATDPRRLPAPLLARLVGLVFQDPELGFLADTVAEEIALGLDPPRATVAAGLLERLGMPLETFGERSPYRLSGGEQRRLSVATALARRPRVLLLDEPTFGQDRRGWEALATIVDELVEAGTAVVAATHDERFATRIASRRLQMADGWIIADDGPGSAAGEPFRAGGA
ncbi:MAG: energy-coupling factor ABC transporter ATP-binding protein [Chloroflexi bacterium]|nr:energy-coupling factor ABC transporter ATP-binding protein [Chloroflexota bacterium]